MFICSRFSGAKRLTFPHFQAFEDFEFSQMEEEAKRESEKEEMSKEIAELTRQLRHHERQLGGIEDQQRKVQSEVQGDPSA